MAVVRCHEIARVSKFTPEELNSMHGMKLRALERKYKLASGGGGCDFIRYIQSYSRPLQVEGLSLQVFKYEPVIDYMVVDRCDLDVDTDDLFTEFMESKVREKYGECEEFMYYPLPRRVFDVVRSMGHSLPVEPTGLKCEFVYRWSYYLKEN